MEATLSSSDPLNVHAGKLERQKEKLFQLCHICLEMLLGTSHSELNGVLCDCESSSTTREHIQHFLEQFVDHEEIISSTITEKNSTLVNHFKELLGNINAHEHKHSTSYGNNNQSKSKQFHDHHNNLINKNRKKILTNASSILSLNTILQPESQNTDSIRRLFEFFKMQQESNRNIIRHAYRQNYVESKSNNKFNLRNHPRQPNASSKSVVDKKITTVQDSTPRFSDLVLFCGGHETENGMDLVNSYSEPSITILSEERVNSSAQFSVESLSDEENDSDFSSQDEADNEQSSPTSSNSYDFETDVDQILNHIHGYNWFVLPNETHVGSAIYEDLIKNVVDPNNVLGELNILLVSWRNRFHLNCSRKHFLYQVMRFMFEKYVKVSYCLEHQPPCKPAVKFELFNTIATPVLKQFCEHINRSRHLVIQIEILAAIESFIYNRPHFRPAIGEIFNQLFTSGIIEAVAFLEWSKLQDPSTCFQALFSPQPEIVPLVKSGRSLSDVSTKTGTKLFTKLSKRFSLGSNNNRIKQTSTNNHILNKSTKNETIENSISSRDKLFNEMKSSFPLFQKNRS